MLSILYVCLAAILRVSQGGSVTVGVPPLTSTSGRQRLTKSSRPWRRTQSFNIADRRRLSIASYTCRLVRRAWPCSAPLLCARHCAKNTPRNTSVVRRRAMYRCFPRHLSRRNVSQNGSELCHASVGALTRSCYGYNRMRYFPRLWTHSKSVPLRLTRRDGHEKPLLFFVPLT